MITNDERREVAARLRDKYRERMEPGQFMPQDLGLQALDYLEDLESCLPDGDSAFTVLADLIDPTCRIVYVDESYSTPDVGRVDEWHYECSRCCYELSDGEMYEFESGALPFRYCPECGCCVTGGERR